jgi:transglutaminase-like putative cysteine protease
MNYQITHNTTYRYSEPASLSQNELFLQPRETAGQRVVASRLEILPAPHYQHQRVDFFGNSVQMFMVQHPHSELQMTAVSEVETRPLPVPRAELTPPWEDVAATLAQPAGVEDLQACQFLFASPLISLDEAVTGYARSSFFPGRPILAGALDLIGRIFADFRYDKAATTVDTSVAEVLASRKGVCQDFAHLCISGLRGIGLAARYVSGYLETIPPPGKEKMVGADASHAWLALYVPGLGWVDLDPTNNLIPAERHITLAWGRDYGDVTPVKGVVMGGGVHSLKVTVDVAARV